LIDRRAGDIIARMRKDRLRIAWVITGLLFLVLPVNPNSKPVQFVTGISATGPMSYSQPVFQSGIPCAGGTITATLATLPAPAGDGTIHLTPGDGFAAVVTITNTGTSPVSVTASQQLYEFNGVATADQQEQKNTTEIPPGASHNFISSFSFRCAAVPGTYEYQALIRSIDGPPACTSLTVDVTVALPRSCAGF
jgi:hypothetical protein